MNKSLLRAVQLSSMALAASQAYAQTAADDGGTTVVVSGLRASARTALAVKRDTMEVVDAISAEDIGKLPDPDVAETPTRIPGVQGYRYGGEGASPVGQGSGLTIRGLSGQTSSQVRTRKPSDFKGLTATLGVNGRENELAKKTDPELFGLLANKAPTAPNTRR